MPVLRHIGASLDRGSEKYATPEIFTGEQVSVKHIHDDTLICLPPAERVIECELRHIVSKAAVIPKHLGNEKYNGQFGLGEYLAEKKTEENLIPSFTKEDKDTMNLIKINAYEFIETQQKSKESAPLIQKIENGINNEVRNQEIAPMQLVPVRREIFSKLNVDRVGPLPIIPGNKHILWSMSPRCHETVPVPETASTSLVEALQQIFRRVFPREIQANIGALFMSILTAELLQKLGICCPLRVPLRLKNSFYCFSRGLGLFPIDHIDEILERNTHLAVRPAECELAQDGVEYRGHVVGLGKWSPAQLKVKALI
ncbi:uncharacterized protein TNCV_2088501 [Trichonephila clavipes]|nr:uncharacterized protein TNCV_2088501 [Trichonephila clavipes]